MLLNSLPFSSCVLILALSLLDFQAEETFVYSYFQGLGRFEFLGLCEKFLLGNFFCLREFGSDFRRTPLLLIGR